MRLSALFIVLSAAVLSGRLEAQTVLPCTATANTRPARAEGTTEIVADVVLTCTGGNPTELGALIPITNFTLAFNAPVTSRILGANGASEALLLLDEPPPGAQFPCDQSIGACPAYGNNTGTGYYGGGVQTPSTPNNRNVFQGFVGTSITSVFEVSLPSYPNSISWVEIPVDPPGPGGTRVFRFTNIRLDATALNGGPLQLTAINASSGSFALSISPTTLSLGTVQTSLSTGVRDAASAAAAPTGVVVPLSATGSTTARYATLRFADLFASAGKPRTIATYLNADTSPPPVNQNTPGVQYNSESGFYNAAFGTYGPGGNLGLAGLADSGTRYMATFTNIPAGFNLYVDRYNSTAAGGPTARLVATDATGAGAFSPVAGTGTVAQLTVSNGTAVAVWEVLRNTSGADNFDFGVYLSYAAGVSTAPAPILVQMRYAPTGFFDTTPPVPLFAGGYGAQTLVSFAPPPLLTVSPTGLFFSVPVGQNPSSQFLTVGSTGIPVAFQLSSSGAFPIQLRASSGSTPASVTVSPITQSLSAGTYSGQITVSGGNTTLLVPVSLSVFVPPPSLTVSPNSLTFIATAGGPNPRAQSISAFSTGVPIDFTVSASGAMPITVQPNGGTTPEHLSVSVSSAGLAAGTYRGTVSAVATGTGADVAVTLIVNPGLQITSLDPATAAAGSPTFTMTVNGLNFTPTTTVRWNGAALPTTFVSATKLTAQVGGSLVAAPGTASVTATTADGAVSNSVPFTITPFSITALSPAQVSAGGPDFTLTITGTGIAPGATATVGGTSLAGSSTSTTLITVTVPASVIAQPGSVSVSVTNPSGVTSNSLILTVITPLHLTSLSPPTATVGNPGFVLTLSGTGFLAGATVQIGDTTLQPTSVTATQITVAVPPALLLKAATLPVQVTNPGNVVSNQLTLAVSVKPAITALNPSATPAGSAAFTLAITGTDLPPNAVAQWNGQPLPTTIVSSTQATAQVPATLVSAAGTASVTISTTDGVVTNALTFTVTPVPTITSLNPTTAAPGAAGFTLTITGTNFSSGSVVQWNGQNLATTVVSATQLTAVVPPSLIATPGTVTIRVVTGGVATGAEQFTIALPQLSGVALNAPTTASSGQDQTITLAIGGTYPVEVTGTLTLTFTGDSGLPDDPAIQFQNSSRVITFNVPAGTTLQPQQIAVKTGTTAGVITITPAFTASGVNVTPPGITPQHIQILRGAPGIASVTCTRNGSGFTVVVDGFTNTREATQATFDFQSASGAALGTTELTVNVGPLFSSWFGGTASAGAGGLFRYTQPFTVQGNTTDIGSIAVKLANTSGSSAQASCTLQ